MTFEDLQRAWNAQDRKLDTLIQLNVSQLRGSHVDSLRTALDRLRRSIVIELVFNAIALFLIAMFIGDHLGDARYLVTAGLLHVSVVLLIAAAVRQLIALHNVDYAGPVVGVQRTLTRLRVERIRTSKWTLIAAPLLWTPVLIATIKGVLGVDAFAILDAKWIATNLLFGVAVIVLMQWAAKRYGDRAMRSPFLRSVVDDLAGRKLNEAMGFLDRLEEFERETPLSSTRLRAQ